MKESHPFQQVRRTYVRSEGRVLSYFSGCDYFRLASHPNIICAVQQGLSRYGLNVAASRITTGNHAIYGQLEKTLATFFGAEAALLTSTGYMTDLVVAQAMAGSFSHALVDERAHAALKDSAQFLGCPVLSFKHRDAESFKAALNRCGDGARPVVLTDGMFSHDGSVAPLKEYLKHLPADAWIVVDDAHGAGVIGKTGGGAVELERVNRRRVVQCVTLSKAFGVYGGAILCSQKMRARLISSPAFIGSTPLPLPLADAALESVSILSRSGKKLRERLNKNAAIVKDGLRDAGFVFAAQPGPIIPLHFNSAKEMARVEKALLKARILPPLIHYPGAPAGGYFRFVISSEHTPVQLANLVRTLKPFAP
jgi:7-keto-8-aminopelargonate synthetase-like enzyme